MKTALIIGSEGQDGTLLLDYLKNRDYSIIGVDREKITTHLNNWNQPVDITNPEDVNSIISSTTPNEIYYLAAFHSSSQESGQNYQATLEQSWFINVKGVINFLEAMKSFSPKSHLFYASSSLVFGEIESHQQDEMTPFNPNTVYGITKLAGQNICKLYRESFNLFASVGILYNHESSLRKEEFLSKKIIKTAIAISRGEERNLTLGSFSSSADWGYAPDFIEAFHKILNHSSADDFIVSSGKNHSVLEFAQIALTKLKLNWNKYLVEDQTITTRKTGSPCGVHDKLFQATGWKPSVTFDEMISLLLEQEGAVVETR